MKKYLAAVTAVLLVSGLGMALELNVGNSTSNYAAQTAIGAFNTSVRGRMSAARVGDLFLAGFTSHGRYAPLASEQAYGAAPSTRATPRAAYGYNGSPRRQLECVYTSGFTVWGDVYGAWERQKAKSENVGYKYRVGGPAIGFDWTTGGLTLGLATTYSWGTMKDVGGRIVGDQAIALAGAQNKNNRDTRTWGLMAYGQYNARMWYANATLGYGRTRHKSSLGLGGTFARLPVGGVSGTFGADADDKYGVNAWNADVEFGMKFRFGRGFLLSPSVGLQYFHSRRGKVDETGVLNYVITAVNAAGTYDIRMVSGARNYYSLELPVGVTFAYEIPAGSAIIVPQLRFAWIPELAREKGRASGTLYATERPGNWGTDVLPYTDHAARRSRHAFNIGAGVQAKLNQTVSLHLDYDVTLRSRYYNHNLNLGVGVTF